MLNFLEINITKIFFRNKNMTNVCFAQSRWNDYKCFFFQQFFKNVVFQNSLANVSCLFYWTLWSISCCVYIFFQFTFFIFLFIPLDNNFCIPKETMSEYLLHKMLSFGNALASGIYNRVYSSRLILTLTLGIEIFFFFLNDPL